MNQHKLIELCKVASNINNIEKIDYRKGSIIAGVNQFGYVYGAKGVVYTLEVRNKLLRLGYKLAYYFDVQCKKWFNKFVLDCSGLITWALRHEIPKLQEQSSSNQFDRCSKKGLIKDIPKVAGLCVWKKGHIGIYDGNGWVYESRGAGYGCVKSKLSSNTWTHWGYLEHIEYEEYKATPKDIVFKIGSTGDKIKSIQNQLIKSGANIIADGIFGKKTMQAVKDFQMLNKYKVTGEVDNVTYNKLKTQL